MKLIRPAIAFIAIVAATLILAESPNDTCNFIIKPGTAAQRYGASWFRLESYLSLVLPRRSDRLPCARARVIPEPRVAYFENFGDRALDFEHRMWTDTSEGNYSTTRVFGKMHSPPFVPSGYMWQLT